MGSAEELEAIRAGKVPGKTLVSSQRAMTGEQLAAWKHVVACARQFVRCADEFPCSPEASAEYYDALEEAQAREARAWEGASAWAPWPTAPGWWCRSTPHEPEPHPVQACGTPQIGLVVYAIGEVESFIHEPHEGWLFTPLGPMPKAPPR